MEIESIKEEEQGVKLKLVFGTLFLIVVIGLLTVYWIVPRESLVNLINSDGEFLSCSNYEFGNESNIQFYENMRYLDSNISYRIDACPIQKEIEMRHAFYEVQNKTALSFYQVSNGEEITVTCDSKNRIENGMFIAGEGGPSNITKAGSTHIILNGKVLLIKESTCERPVVAIHELFHALGFTHSNNVCNIMYNFSKCSQGIGNDMIELVDDIYSYSPLPDLKIENLTGEFHERYLDLNFSIKNIGLLNSEDFFIDIYSNKKLSKKVDIKKIEVGGGAEIVLKNVDVEMNVKDVYVAIIYNFEELNKSNNNAYLSFS